MWVLGIAATFCGLFLLPGFALQIQCYQCEEFQLNNDCSSPEFIVNCTVNVQDMCQKEVMEQSAGSSLEPDKMGMYCRHIKTFFSILKATSYRCIMFYVLGYGCEKDGD
ncbi:Ly6/PLAUR domain-containing protein 1 [Tupaia chinensis]|uniref:Ly6/PLAUR domain-containing protein 1 n=1 Tax=Tupaia chinensis TaxID=246437 RepID=L9KPK4_TUPCH|nr:Ly6/PLAUR domain-containing protein 1 [Tupaia chinensis]